TSYRALIVRGGLKAGETVLITGNGGGCGLFLIQFAKAIGAKVFFTTGQKSKLDFLEKKFNIKGVLYTEVNWSDKLKQIVPEVYDGLFDLIVDSSGGKFVSTYMDLLRPSGRYVFFGQTLGPPTVELLQKWSSIYSKSLIILGSDLGSFTEFKQIKVNDCTSDTEYRISLTKSALKDDTDPKRNVKRVMEVIVGLE
ncbi:22103_t:CDS:2, partial [Dentiscutata erythropus]